jgi:pimeloyl-ACP methyl ester carboxylesterase
VPGAPQSLALLHGFASSFNHGWSQSGWPDILADVGCTVPVIDLPGHGSSSGSADPEDYAHVEDDVLAQIPEDTTNAVGFSAGGQILLRLALAHPGRFERLALLGVGDNLFAEGDPAVIVDALTAESEPEDVQARLFRRLAVTAGNDPTALAAFLRRPAPPIRPEDLAAVACPVLVVLGDRDFIGKADLLVASLPSASLVQLPGVDHFATPSDFGAIDATLRFFGLG